MAERPPAGISLDGSSKVRVSNGVIVGCEIAVHAPGVTDLQISGVRAYRTTQDREDPSSRRKKWTEEK